MLKRSFQRRRFTRGNFLGEIITPIQRYSSPLPRKKALLIPLFLVPAYPQHVLSSRLKRAAWSESKRVKNSGYMFGWGKSMFMVWSGGLSCGHLRLYTERH